MELSKRSIRKGEHKDNLQSECLLHADIVLVNPVEVEESDTCVPPHALQGHLTRLIHLLRSPDKVVWREAGDELVKTGESAVTYLVQELKCGDLIMCCRAISTLGWMERTARTAVPTLIELLQSEESTIRGVSAWALGKIGSSDGEAWPSLINTLRDPVADVRRSAADALSRIGDVAGMPVLITALAEEPEPYVRSTMVSALGHIGNPRALPSLALTALTDVDSAVRSSALSSMLDVDRVNAAPTLVKALEDADLRVRENANLAIKTFHWYMQPSEITPIPPELVELQWHANPEIRWAAVTLLGVLGNPVSATAIAAILPNEQEHGVYFAAVETLKKMPSAAVLSIEKLIRPSQSGVRQWNCPFAVETLAFVGGSTATHSIESFLDDPDPEFRRVAAAALGDLRETFSMPTLVEALRHDKDPEVRSEAAWALEKIGDRVESERKFLVTALAEVVERDRSSIVRVQVHDALMALGVVYGAGPGKVATGNSGEQLISETLRRDASNVCRQLFTFCLTGEVLYEDCINAFVLDWMVKQLRDRKHLDIKYTTLRDHLEKVQSLFAAHITDLAFLYDSGQGQHGYEITPQWDVAWHIAMRILERKQPINLDMRT